MWNEPPGLVPRFSPFPVFFVAVLCSACGLLSQRREATSLWMQALDLGGSPAPGRESGPPAGEEKARLEKSLDLAKESLALDPALFPAHLYAIETAHRLGRTEETVRLFHYALSLFPNQVELRLGYLRYLEERKAPLEERVAVVRSGLERDPRALPLRFVMAELLMEVPESARDGEELESFLRESVGLLGSGEREYYARVQCAYLCFHWAEDVDPARAVSLLRSLLALDFDAVKEGMGVALLSGHRAGVSALLEPTPEGKAGLDHPLLHAWFLLMTDRFRDAEAAAIAAGFEAAARRAGHPEASAVIRGYAALGTGDFAAAHRLFFGVLDRYPACLEAFYGLKALVERAPAPPLDAILARVRKAFPLAKTARAKRVLYGMMEDLRRRRAAAPAAGDG